MFDIDLFKKWLAEKPEEAYQRVLELRGQFKPDLFVSTQALGMRENALAHARKVTECVLSLLQKAGLTMSNVDPGHGPGHWARDYMNALRLLSGSEGEFTSPHIVAGFIGGVLHDVGCTIVPRYDEKNTPLRHGEVMGLLFDALFSNDYLGINYVEKRLVIWAIMAHTHYLAPQKVVWQGREVIVEPYRDCDDEGKPLFGIWLPRWVDRLECSGSETFPARHWLTLGDPHTDFSKDGFYEVEFTRHTRPILRSNEEIKADAGQRTMLEHLRMFADSQTNASPYGRFDQGSMIELRDAKRERLRGFIAAVASDSHPDFSESDVVWISEVWNMFLATVIEPSDAGLQAVHKLGDLFDGLPFSVRVAWCHGFLVAMRDYLVWGMDMKNFLAAHSFREIENLPFAGNTSDLLTPRFLYQFEAKIHSFLS